MKLPPYLMERKIASGTAYYWHVPKRMRPDIKPRSAALGYDREAAIAFAEAIHRANPPEVRKICGLIERTSLVQEFAQLEAITQARSLNDEEQRRLTEILAKLGFEDVHINANRKDIPA